jgi:hypothetical protein
MYGNTTYGSGNVFNTGGNSGSSLPSLSTSGADMNSPEMKEAQAKRDAACALVASPEPMFGGIQASNCRDATAEWLQALSNSQKTYTPPPVTSSTNHNSDKSESLKDFMKRMLSDTTTQNSDELSIYSCSDKNSYVKSKTECACKDGYILNAKNKCAPKNDVYQEYCSIPDPNSFYNSSIDRCQCFSGYVIGKNDKCISASSSCAEITGVNSHPEGNLCVCSDGYVIGENKKCISMTSWCVETVGVNSHPEGNLCVCSDGYYYDASSKKCIEDLANIENPITQTQNQEISTQNVETKEILEPAIELKWYKRIFNWFF